MQQQDALFSSNTSNLCKGQGSPNNSKRCTNHLILLIIVFFVHYDLLWNNDICNEDNVGHN
jgi:hypothetical protein